MVQENVLITHGCRKGNEKAFGAERAKTIKLKAWKRTLLNKEVILMEEA